MLPLSSFSVAAAMAWKAGEIRVSPAARCQNSRANSSARGHTASVAALGQYALVCERIRLEKPAVANFLDWFADQLAD